MHNKPAVAALMLFESGISLTEAGLVQAGKAPAFTSSAILVIIGDEILSGKVAEQNAQFLCRELFLLGWRVTKASPSRYWL